MKRAVSPSLGVLFTAFLVLVAGPGCKPNTRDNPMGCMLYPGDMCPGGQHCDNFRCVADDAGAAGQGVGGDGSGGAGVGGDAGTSGTAGGAGAGGGTTGLGGTPADGGMDGPSNHCTANTQCADKTGTTACNLTSNLCVECVDDTTCGGTKPACDTAKNSCVACTSTNASACSGTTPVCDPTQHLCVECTGDSDCKTPEKSFCSKNQCVGCTDGNACKARDLSKPVCGASGACVACDTDKDCGGTTPFCGSQKSCVPCKQAPQNSSCAGLSSATPVCGDSGACVQCGKDMDCAGSPTTPFCSDAGACVSCGSPLAPRTCAMLAPTKPLCSTATGACVECLGNNDCPDAKAVCSSSNTCGVCTADTDCVNRGPGVCMSHLDGRCASTKETIYVQNTTNCADATGATAGSATAPLCSMQPATSLASAMRDLIVVRGTVSGATGAFASNVSIVGQNSGTIAGTVNPALHVSAGTTYARDLKLSTFDSMGLQADGGSTVQLEHLLVTGNAGQASDAKGGGILLDGAAFDIRNTTVTSNGPGTFSGGLWGGILVNSPPSSGPRSLKQVTVQGNNPTGISCTSAISGTGVSASSNTSLDIVSACGISACGSASSSCGAQP